MFPTSFLQKLRYLLENETARRTSERTPSTGADRRGPVRIRTSSAGGAVLWLWRVMCASAGSRPPRVALIAVLVSRVIFQIFAKRVFFLYFYFSRAFRVVRSQWIFKLFYRIASYPYAVSFFVVFLHAHVRRSRSLVRVRLSRRNSVSRERVPPTTRWRTRVPWTTRRNWPRRKSSGTSRRKSAGNCPAGCRSSPKCRTYSTWSLMPIVRPPHRTKPSSPTNAPTWCTKSPSSHLTRLNDWWVQYSWICFHKGVNVFLRRFYKEVLTGFSGRDWRFRKLDFKLFIIKRQEVHH